MKEVGRGGLTPFHWQPQRLLEKAAVQATTAVISVHFRSASEAHGVRELLMSRTRPLAASGLSLNSLGKEGPGRGFSCQLHRAAPPTRRPLAPKAFRYPLRKVLKGL